MRFYDYYIVIIKRKNILIKSSLLLISSLTFKLNYKSNHHGFYLDIKNITNKQPKSPAKKRRI